MRVEPEITQHVKFRRLKKMVGERAMEFLVLIWSHCQNNQRGEFWPGATAEYVETLCDWDGDGQPGELFKALVECGRPKVGFIEQEADGLRIHDWDEMNRKIVANWENGARGQRPKKTQPRLGLTHSKPNGNPTSDTEILGSEAISKGPPADNPLLTQSRIGLTHSKPSANPVRTHGTVRTLTEHNFTEEGGGGGPDYEVAGKLIRLLNELTGAEFNPSIADMDQVLTRLHEVRNDVPGVEAMMRRQATLWKNNPRLAGYLRPSTLFGEKFREYYGQRNLSSTTDPATRKVELQTLIDQSPANRDSVYHSEETTPTDRALLKAYRAELASLNV